MSLTIGMTNQLERATSPEVAVGNLASPPPSGEDHGQRGPQLDRRNFLRWTTYAGAAVAINPLGKTSGCGSDIGLSEEDYLSVDPRNPTNFDAPLLLPGATGALGMLSLTQSVEMKVTTAQIDPGVGVSSTYEVYECSRGGDVYFNPILLAQPGQRVNLSMVNKLADQPTIIHWHGLLLPWLMDGHPSYDVLPGARYDYDFTITNRAGTYWYHPHPMAYTARQAYMGQASFVIVTDAEEEALRQALDLTLGVTDIPLALQDRRLAKDWSPLYAPDLQEDSDGYLGDVIFTNFTINPRMDVATRLYRFRVLNGSNARTYRLAFRQGTTLLPFRLIGTDGGLLEEAHTLKEVFVSPGERVDILMDFGGLRIGDELFLVSLAFDPANNLPGDILNPSGGKEAHQSMGHEVADEPAPPPRLGHGEDFFLTRFVVTSLANQTYSVPSPLSVFSPVVVDTATPRPIRMSASYNEPFIWTINGYSYQEDEYPIVVQKDTVEIWEVTNEVNGMPHPFHLHGPLFRVLDRSSSPEQLAPLVIDEKGRLATDLGWKDTVLVWPGERVRIAVPFFHNFEGEQIYLAHCHILEHEDHGMMMVNYKIV